MKHGLSCLICYRKHIINRPESRKEILRIQGQSTSAGGPEFRPPNPDSGALTLPQSLSVLAIDT